MKVIYSRGSGCYGINGADTVSYDAALMSQAGGRPVRVQLSRQDEMANENFGLAFVVDQRVGLDSDGNIIAWDYEAWSPTRGGRPGYAPPGQPGDGLSSPASIRRPSRRDRRRPRRPGRSPTARTSCRRTWRARSAASAGGTGTVKSERMLSRVVESPFWTGPLRSPNRLQNTFAHECMMDELAAAAKADPVEYRLRHLRDPRLHRGRASRREGRELASRVLRRRGRARNATGIVSGRGIACVLYEGDNGYCAMVAEVDVHLDTGAVDVKRLVMALDCGPDLQSRRPPQPGRRRRASRHEPRAVRRSDVGPREGDVGRLAHVSHVAGRDSRFPSSRPS